MPELLMPRMFSPEAREEIKQEPKENLTSAVVADILKSHDPGLLGSGVECVVVEVDGQPEKVVGVSYVEMDAKKAKEVYYLQRIFSTLFPHNFPHFYASVGSKKGDGKISGTIREKVEGVKRLDYEPKSRFESLIRRA